MKAYLQRWRNLIVLVVVGVALLNLPHAAGLAQDTSPVYYPQTGQFLSGAFRVFYEQNGGTANFGFPITPPYFRNEDRQIVQYFERARFELIEEPSRPPFIRLGDIGTDYIRFNGYNFGRIEPVPDTPTRRYFPETGHKIEGIFKDYWDNNNGAFFFGGPLSELVAEVLPSGEQKTVQYFERTRLELGASGAYETFSRGVLGNTLAPCQLQIPRPRNLPPSGPVLEGDPSQCANPETIVMGRVFPESGLPGTRFAFEAIRFRPGEPISLWINLPDGTVRPIPYQGFADSDGNVLVAFDTRPDDRLGLYSIVGEGNLSRRMLLASFSISR